MTIDIQKAIETALGADSRLALWAALQPCEASLTEHLELAKVWAEALRTSPERPSLQDEAERIMARWPEEISLVLAACDALLRVAERRPVDEPPFEAGPAGVVANAASRTLEKLAFDARVNPELGGRLLAMRGNALSLMGPKRDEDALAAFKSALAVDELRGDWHFDVGRLHKRMRRFQASLEASQRARQLLGDEKRVLWNVAISATGSGQGEQAAEVWRLLGMPVQWQEGQLPWVESLPPVKVRVATLGPGHTLGARMPDHAASFESLWVQPLSPCHGVVRTATFREAMVDFGDVVLWDGVPVAVVETDHGKVPCFPMLTKLKAGKEKCFRFLIRSPHEIDIGALSLCLSEDGFWHVHGEVPTGGKSAGIVAYGKLVLNSEDALAEVEDRMTAWFASQPKMQIAIPTLYEALGETQNAGQHHKRWGVFERLAAAEEGAS